MAKPASLIRFVGEPDRTVYFLKLGPMGEMNPPERTFQGGDEAWVHIEPNSQNPGCVDLGFADGQFAIEVSREYFVVVERGRARFG